jgi:hypothetical protein
MTMGEREDVDAIFHVTSIVLEETMPCENSFLRERQTTYFFRDGTIGSKDRHGLIIIF